jgi:hypothetical protein
MSASFKTYQDALERAHKLADLTRMDQGIERNRLLGGFSVFMLPRRENRYGFELRCEVVHPAPGLTAHEGHGWAK